MNAKSVAHTSFPGLILKANSGALPRGLGVIASSIRSRESAADAIDEGNVARALQYQAGETKKNARRLAHEYRLATVEERRVAPELNALKPAHAELQTRRQTVREAMRQADADGRSDEFEDLSMVLTAINEDRRAISEAMNAMQQTLVNAQQRIEFVRSKINEPLPRPPADR